MLYCIDFFTRTELRRSTIYYNGWVDIYKYWLKRWKLLIERSKQKKKNLNDWWKYFRINICLWQLSHFRIYGKLVKFIFMMLLNDFLWRNLRLSFGMFGRLVVSLIIDDYNIVDYKGFFCCCGCCILLLLLLLLSMIINFNSVQKIPLAMYNERFVYIHFDFILLFAICCCFAGLLLIMMMAMTMLLMMRQHLWMFCSVQFSSVQFLLLFSIDSYCIDVIFTCDNNRCHCRNLQTLSRWWPRC